MKWPSLCVLIVFLSTALAGNYQVSVTSVEVWVKAFDKSGKPVAGLTRDDFEIYEDGNKMDANCFEESTLSADLTQPQTEMAETPVAPQSKSLTAARKFVLFLDLYNTSPHEYLTIQPRMEQFLDQVSIHNWQVMLAALLPNRK